MCLQSSRQLHSNSLVYLEGCRGVGEGTRDYVNLVNLLTLIVGSCGVVFVGYTRIMLSTCNIKNEIIDPNNNTTKLDKLHIIEGTVYTHPT